MNKQLVLLEKGDHVEGQLFINGRLFYVFSKDSFHHSLYNDGVSKDTQKEMIIKLSNDFPWDPKNKNQLSTVSIIIEQ